MGFSPGLRSKILLGFGGLLVMLLAVSLIGQSVLNRYSNDMQRSFKEDYQSVQYCEDFAHAVDHIDTALQLHFWQGRPIDVAEINKYQAICDRQLETQRPIATLPGEKELTDRLSRLWEEYKQTYPHLLDIGIAENIRRDDYALQGLPKAIEVQAAAHELIDMNLGSMLSVHGRVREMAAQSRSAMTILTASAFGLAVIYALLLGRFILRPVRILTNSVREIERGNLDLRVPVQSNDELGVLAAAVNAMATQIKAYRQADHERLVRTERTTQLAIDSLPDAVVVLNLNGSIELANETAKRLFHVAPGMTVADLNTPWLTDLYGKILDSGHNSAPSGYESTIQVMEDREVRYYLPRTVPISSEDARPIGATIVLADVTGLRRLDEMKNGLLSLVSHELKTPLTSLRMIMHLVTEQRIGPLSAKQKELLDTARDDAEKLHGIVENLLDMERIESGRALMDIHPTSPVAIIEQSAESMRGAFELQKVALAVSVPADLPYVKADPIRIRHVLINLLSNALRYTSGGGHVRIWARGAQDWVEIGVTDDGAGISRQYLPRVFEKFYRVPGQQGSTGSGLGLSIAKDIVEAHGGHIRVESTEGAGSTFAFTLIACPTFLAVNPVTALIFAGVLTLFSVI